MTALRPMLASAAELDDVKFPVYASVKIDGIRCLAKDGIPQSRSGKVIPNLYVQKLFKNPAFQGLDGEITVGAPNDKNVMQETTSGIMSHEGEPGFTYWVFDIWQYDAKFEMRYAALKAYVDKINVDYPYVRVLEQTIINTREELEAFEIQALADGYEGIMVRSVDSPYKNGRSTLKQGYLLKLKRFVTNEAVVVGKVERMINNNEQVINELGYAERSSSKGNKTPAGDLGALVCIDIASGEEFEIGTGFTAAQRGLYWNSIKSGEIVSYKSFPVGVKDAPRFPVFVGFRNKADCDPSILMQADIHLRKYAAKPSESNYPATIRDGLPQGTTVPLPRVNVTNKELISDIRHYLELCPLLTELLTRFEEVCDSVDGFEDRTDGDAMDGFEVDVDDE